MDVPKIDKPQAATKIQRFFRCHQLEKQELLHQAISKSSNTLLLNMMNLRFQCMRAVAAAKFPSQKPIEDKAQEARVINAVKELAIEKDITNLEKIEHIFQHNIELSKMIQRPYYGLIWKKAPRDTQILVNNAYIQLRNLASQAGFTQILCSQEERSFNETEVLVLARDIIQQVNQEIIEILSNQEKYKPNEITQEELEKIITVMCANYMTPSELNRSLITIQSLANELTACSSPKI